MTGQRARKMIRQGKQAAQRFVPGGQLPTIVEQAHPLRQIVERRLKHDIAFGQFARAGAGILRLGLGNIGIDADDAAFAGAQFVDLDPAAIGEPLHLCAIGNAMFGEPVGHPTVGRDLCPGGALAMRHDPRNVVEGHAFVQMVRHLRPEAKIGFVMEDQPILRIEQDEPLVDRFDRIAQAHAGGIGAGMGIAQVRIGLCQSPKRIFQLDGAIADLCLQ